MSFRKLVLLILVMVLASNTGISQSQGSGSLKDRSNPYYWGTIDKIVITNLSINTFYAVLFGGNLDPFETQWVNFTSETLSVVIQFEMKGRSIDNNSILVDQLQVDLYTADDFTANATLVDTAYYPIVRGDDFQNWDLIASISQYWAAIFIVAMILYLTKRILFK